MGSLRTGDYRTTFLSRYPTDKNLCDDAAHWWPGWPGWHEYYLGNSNIPVYGARIFLTQDGIQI